METAIWDAGHREHGGAGRPSIDSGLRARARYMAARCDFPDALGARISNSRCPPAPVFVSAEAVPREHGELSWLGHVDMRRDSPHRLRGAAVGG